MEQNILNLSVWQSIVNIFFQETARISGGAEDAQNANVQGVIMKKPLIIIFIIVACSILIWIASLVKCEVLTFQHWKEFETLYKETNMLGEQEYLKVLDYSDISARVYYVGINRAGGNILRFVKQNGQWVYAEWEETVWSKTGSADGFMWPYIR